MTAPGEGEALVSVGEQATPAAGTMDPKFLQQWVENQGKEINVRAQQVALEAQQTANAHDYAKRALDA